MGRPLVNLRRFLKGSIEWEQRIGGDDYEGVEYAAPKTIPAHKKLVAREVRGPGGTEVRNVDEITVEVLPDVTIGDKADGEIVQARESMTDVRGRTKGYKLYTEPVT